MAHRLPAEGTPHDFADRLRAYVGPSCPDWIGQSVGSPPEELAEYLHLAQVSADELPDMYRAYALAFGRSNGGIMNRVGWTCEIPSLIDDYKDCYRFDPQDINPRFPCVGDVTVIDGEIMLHLDEAGEHDAPVVEPGWDDILELISPSWEQVVFVAASKMVASRTSPRRVFWSSDDTIIANTGGPADYNAAREQTLKAAAELGCVEQWFSGGRYIIASDGTRLLWSAVRPNGTIRLYWYDPTNLAPAAVKQVFTSMIGPEAVA